MDKDKEWVEDVGWVSVDRTIYPKWFQDYLKEKEKKNG